MKPYTIFLWAVIILGIVLRFWQIDFTDVHTDEAQFILDSRAHPPLGIFFIHVFQYIFGVSLFSARLVSSVLGAATVGVIALYARQVVPKHALLITALAAVFTPHVLLSKYIYLDVPQTFFWMLLLYSYTVARKQPNFYVYCLVFVAAMCSYLVKVQGMLFPFFLFVIHVVLHWRTFYKDTLSWLMLLAGFPILLYLLSMPDIGGIILFYRPTLYGFYDPSSRLLGILYNWWVTLGVFSVLVFISFFELKRLSWPVWLFLGMALIMSMILSPHMFYLAYLLIVVVPLGILLGKRLPKVAIIILVALLTVWSMYITRFGFTQFMIHPFYENEPYWNTHADIVNSYLPTNEPVVAIGIFGHQVNWYILPEVVNANNRFTTEQLTEFSTILRFGNSTTVVPRNYSSVYTDERVEILQR